MDASALLAITAVWNVLVPYLREVGNAASKKSGEAVVEWIRNRLSPHPDASQVLKHVEANPSDSDAVNDLASRLSALIRQDSDSRDALKQQLEALGLPARERINISQSAGNDAKQFGQVYGNIRFDAK